MNSMPLFHLKSKLMCMALAFLISTLCMHAARSWAEESAETARRLSESGEILPLETILRAAKTHKNGKVLETELERRKNRYIYEVEILDENSQVWEIKLDAKTGKLIKLERDD